MPDDDTRKNSHFSFEENGNKDEHDIDFTFSDIPVLGKDETDGSKDFSFDTFKPAKIEHSDEHPELEEDEEHIESFKKLLLDTENETEEEEKGGSFPDVPTADDIKKKKEKWEKIAKSKRKGNKKVVAIAASLVLFLTAGALSFFILSSDEKAKKPNLAGNSTLQPNPDVTSPRSKTGAKTKSKHKKTGKKQAEPTRQKKKKRVQTTGKISATDKNRKNANPKDREKKRSVTKGKAEPITSGKKETQKIKQQTEKKESDELTEEEIEKLRKQRYIKRETAKIFNEIKKLTTEKDDKQKDVGKLKELCLKLFKLHPKDLQLQLKAQNLLINKISAEDFITIYFACYESYKNTLPGIYCYARALGTIPPVEKYYKQIIKRAPEMKDAYMQLGKLYIYMRKWNRAIDIYKQCLNRTGNDFRIRFLITETKLRIKPIRTPIIELENYLREKNVPKSQIGLKLIPLAQRLRDSTLSSRYLKYIKTDPKLSAKYKFYSIVNKALYGKLTENDFLPWYPEEARKIYILFLLSRRRYMDVQLLPTPPDQFPDFWKIYIGWLSGKDPLWKEEARILIKKYVFKSDKTYSIIASVWLKRKDKKGNIFSPRAARQLLFYVHPDNEPLFYFMLGEIYRKQRKRTKSKIMYSKALKNRQSIYYFMIRRRTRTRPGPQI